MDVANAEGPGSRGGTTGGGRGERSVSTGHLPQAESVRALVTEAHRRFVSNGEGKVADYIPALAKTPAPLFGVCVAGVSGALYEAGDAGYEFSIQSVSKPFVFALVCQAIGEDEARDMLGVNSTGLPSRGRVIAFCSQFTWRMFTSLLRT